MIEESVSKEIIRQITDMFNDSITFILKIIYLCCTTPKFITAGLSRLKGYDYAQVGLYFVTICCQDRACLFGEIIDGKMIMNDAGEIANVCWMDVPNHFPNSVLHDYVVMPNHIHGIIELKSECVGAENIPPNHNGANDDSPLRSPSKTIGSIVRGFKIGGTKWMRQNTNVNDVWQRNYYEHIIRNEQSYQTICKYIINNPAKWVGDKFYRK